ncbi:hypothetical protein GCM10010492_21720 [Saccharothrix mutabilis subsp. mutabilis]|uniref:Uncharacterized protein n=1 Tax=Saccharothrix mutabilis subsp. mutabilis TaxID=66855 RepID=A0ABN0TJH5_9PSEU
MIRTWLATALRSPHFHTHGFESIHTDDLDDTYTEADAIPRALDHFTTLVTAFADHQTDVMAMLVIQTGYHDDLALTAPPITDLETAWDHWTPPELYLLARRPHLTPYAVEEYKRPYPPNTFTAPHGTYHTYYRCHRQGDSPEFTSAIYIEHHP